MDDEHQTLETLRSTLAKVRHQLASELTQIDPVIDRAELIAGLKDVTTVQTSIEALERALREK